jgi:hypothetical protein
VDLLLSGKIHKYVGWQADFVATYSRPTAKVDGAKSTAAILDLIGKFELHDAFNVWFGRMLVPSDRSNFSGAWFMAPWSYPGLFTAVRPWARARVRSAATTAPPVWGPVRRRPAEVLRQRVRPDRAQTSPLYSSRINLAADQPRAGLLPQQHLLRWQGHPGHRSCRLSTRRTARPASIRRP